MKTLETLNINNIMILLHLILQERLRDKNIKEYPNVNYIRNILI